MKVENEIKMYEFIKKTCICPYCFESLIGRFVLLEESYAIYKIFYNPHEKKLEFELKSIEPMCGEPEFRCGNCNQRLPLTLYQIEKIYRKTYQRLRRRMRDY